MSIYMQFAPFKLKSGDWAQQSDALRDTRNKNARPIRPRSPVENSRRPNPHAPRSRSHLRPNRRPPLPRRTRPRPNFHHAPPARLGPLRHSGQTPLPLRQRHPPRQRRNRRLRPQRRPRNPPRPQKVSPDKEASNNAHPPRSYELTANPSQIEHVPKAKLPFRKAAGSFDFALRGGNLSREVLD